MGTETKYNRGRRTRTLRSYYLMERRGKIFCSSLMIVDVLLFFIYLFILRKQQPYLAICTLYDTVEMVTISAKKLPTVMIEKSLFNYLDIRTDTVVQRILIYTYKKQKYTLNRNTH
jgi:hypothetical protein